MTTAATQLKTNHTGTKYAGAKWLQDCFRSQDLSPLAVRVSNVLGQVYEGIYHETHPVRCFYSIEPSATIVTLRINRSMATYDSDKLTRLFLCCQAASLDISIAGSIKGLRVTFKDAKTSEINPLPTMPTVPEMTGFEDLADVESPEWRSFIGKSRTTYLNKKSQWLSVQWTPDGMVSALCIRSGVISMQRLAEIVARSHDACCRIELEGRCPFGHGQIGLFMSARSRTAKSIMKGHPTPEEAIEKLRPIWDIDYESLN